MTSPAGTQSIRHTSLRYWPRGAFTTAATGTARWLLAAIPVVLVAVVAGEVASRLDDWLFSDTAVLASPDREFDLVHAEPWGQRGKPHGHYRKWRLNNYGFQGPDIPLRAERRVMVLGASETFGLYEKAGNAYPAVLDRQLASAARSATGSAGEPRIEVVNAAIAGMALPSMTTYWEQWASRFRPQTVVVYPSPLFYLDDQLPKSYLGTAIPPPPAFQSRLLQRLVDQAKQVPLLRRLRARHVIAGKLVGKGPGDLFTSEIPRDRLAAFSADLERLATSIEQRGARPVLVTHAFKTTSPPVPADHAELEYFRIFFPRVTLDGFAAFEAAAREAVIALAGRHGWAVIDAAASLTGRRELFADPVHFNDTGSARMAGIIADRLPDLVAPAGASR